MAEIFIIMLIAIIIVLCLLLKLAIVKKRVIVTIVQNLPIGIFRDKNKSYEIQNKVYIREKNKSDVEKNESDDGQHKSISDSNTDEKISIGDNDLVYWTPNGKTYHVSTSCFALCRSKVINYGTIEESGKSTLCHLCNDDL
ncbi:MAG: hypothetical protein Q4F66_02260 [Clostridium sp.]|nr:hypothetical protein [Clostridium sp.]